MSFQCNARYFLVTYAQCGDLDGFSVMELFSSLGAECIIGRELHEDQGIHLHAFVDFGAKFRGRGSEIFDVEGRHPNIQTVGRTPWKAYDYAIKDGDVVCGGAERPIESSNSGASTYDKWVEISGAETRAEFWELVFRLDPKAGCCNHASLAKYADWRFAVDPPVYEHPGGVSFINGDIDGRDEWVRQAKLGSERDGGSHVYIMGLVSGAELMKAPEADYAVFDDMRGGFKYWPSFKEWLGCQAYVTVKVLYREPALVKWNKPTIYVANSDPREEVGVTDVEIEWLNQNCHFIHVEESIFRANTT
uniref:Replication-associated protein n=1 Tax=Giant panda feces-associated gemycircularvirus TaxID=2864014 RepID=A0A8K1M4Z5_9VIRU|nr:replication-associated protein [Giant panda feces-associated gemycircularvirus]